MAKEPVFDYAPETAMEAASGEAVLVKDLNIANAAASVDIVSRASLRGYQVLSIQAEWSGLTGTLDGTLDLIQSHTFKKFDLLGVQSVMTAASDSSTMERLNFGGKFAGIRFAKTGITAGLLTLTLIVKRK